MTRILISAVCFVLVFVFETSFLSSLPSILALTPLVFGLSIYLMQSHGLVDGIFWMGTHGILLEMFHFSIIPFVSIGWVIAGIGSFFLARHVFSNRSFYGSVACALCGFFFLVMTESLFAGVSYFVRGLSMDWSDYFFMHVQRATGLLFVMMFLFASTRHIRKLFPSAHFTRS